MVWVRSEYAGELAVLSAWLATLIPWNVTYSPEIAGGRLLFVRFPFAEVRFAFGVPLAESVAVFHPLAAVELQRGQSVQVAYEAWVVGAAILAVAVLFSVLYYAREDRVEAGPVDPVRTMGGLLGLAALSFAAATALLIERGFPGVPIPIGVVLLFALSGVLLTVDRA